MRKVRIYTAPFRRALRVGRVREAQLWEAFTVAQLAIGVIGFPIVLFVITPPLQISTLPRLFLSAAIPYAIGKAWEAWRPRLDGRPPHVAAAAFALWFPRYLADRRRTRPVRWSRGRRTRLYPPLATPQPKAGKP